jgi:hypothetical protein
MAPLVDRHEKPEKGRSSLSTPGDRFAYWLSQITSPFVVGLGVLGYVSPLHPEFQMAYGGSRSSVLV